MTPRAGGEANKFGSRYEGTWTVRQLFEVLFGRAASLTVESTGDAGLGVEFTLERSDGTFEAHQVKRQRGSANSWTPRALQSEGVLAAARAQVEAGREFHFVSTVPSRRLDRLSDRARRASDLQHFVEGHLDGEEIREDFDFLSSSVWESPQQAWQVLRGLWTRWPDERELRESNAAFAAVLLTGAPAGLASLALGDLIANNLALPLTLDSAVERLEEYNLRLDPLARRTDLSTIVGSLSRSWREGIAAEMLDPPIARTEAGALVDSLVAEKRLIVASGNAGEGKTGVLYQVVERLSADGWPVLAFRLDRLEPFASPTGLGEQLGLAASPAAALAAAAGDQPALLLIDQLDAVSLASGRMPSSFDAVAELLREAASFPQMRVLLACRQFDIENDARLRALVGDDGTATQVKVELLGEEQVREVLTRIGVDAEELDALQLRLLSSPLHLVLLSAVAEDEGALSFTSTKDLFDLFWENRSRATRRQRQPPPRFTEVVDALVDSMSVNQRLSVAVAELDSGDLLEDAGVLTSEHVLVRDGQQVAFFHEAFFDYAFARRWIRRGESLVEFLLGGEQELFRRAQVRQVLSHLRDEDSARFVREVSAVLMCEDIRFHIKDVVLALIASLRNPTDGEWRMVKAVLAQHPSFEGRIWSSLRSVGWFDQLQAEGKLAQWLAAEDEALRGRTLEILGTAVKQRPDQVAGVLGPFRGKEGFIPALMWVARFGELAESRALFDLVLQAVRSGLIEDNVDELWLDSHGLGEHAPAWTVELLHAFFVERPEAVRIDGADGKIADLRGRDHGLLELISQSSKGAPREFCEALLPYLLAVMAASGTTSEDRFRDPHFGFRIWRADIHEVDDALLYGLRRALVEVVAHNAEAARPMLEALENDPHDAAQWLLYEGLRAGAASYADWAAKILLQRESRLFSGFIDSSLWTTRELLQAISPRVDDELFARLEAVLADLAPDWERTPGGYSAFTLLSGLDEARLSATGKRRLGELRRKFDCEQPPEPMGIRIQTVGSPIPQEAARRMDDEQWLGAISRYSTGERERGIELRGDAEELAQVLETEAKRDPERFARLAFRFTPATHPAYSEAVLRGVGDPEATIEADDLFAVLRHVAGLGRVETDRWLGWALRGQLDGGIPNDIIELILDRALHSPDPEREAWLTEAWGGKTFYNGDPWTNGMNTARGAAAESLAELLIYDVDGHRSALLAGRLSKLAEDPSVAVRSSVARLLAAALRFEREAAVTAFELLIESDDRLLAARPVEELIAYIGDGDPEMVKPVIERMLASNFEVVRSAGGRLAAFAGLELGLGELLSGAAASADAAVRQGAARVCAARVAATSDRAGAEAALRLLFNDEDKGVREAAAEVAMALRGADLDPHMALLRTLISSRAFSEALGQLLFTLDDTTAGLEELALLCAERFIATHRTEMNNIATRAAGDARSVGELLLRTYSQTADAAVRTRSLDLIDELLALEAYGISDLVNAAER